MQSELIRSIEAAQAAGRYADAERLCQTAITRDPGNASLRVWLGWIAMGREAYADAAAAARHAATLPNQDPAGTVRLLVYACAASGDWASATAALLDLAGTDARAARAMAIETAPSFLACINGLQRSGAFREAARSFEHVPGILGDVAPDVMHEIRATASICHLALGDTEAAIAIFGRAVASGAVAEPTGEAQPRPLLVTSLMPARIEVQKAAVASWRRMGFDVASLNAGDEIGHLHAEFEGVTFHRAARDAREHLGRPLVYVDDMLAILARHPGRIGGVINADVAFSHDAGEVLAEALFLAEDAVLFGYRVDVDRLGRPPGPDPQIFLFGYDWFLFRTDQAHRMAGGEMVFGAPWWDIWLPLRARSLGLDIVNVRHPIALHEKHAIRWDEASLKTMGRVLTNRLVADARQMPCATRFQRCLGALAKSLQQMDPEAFADRRNLDWLASLLRGLVQWEAAPLRSDRQTRLKPFWDSTGQI